MNARAMQRLAIMQALDRMNTARRTRTGMWRWERSDVGLPTLADPVIGPLFLAALVTDDNGKLVLTASGRAYLRVQEKKGVISHG